MDNYQEDSYPRGREQHYRRGADLSKQWRKFKNGMNISASLVLFSAGLLVGADLLTPAHIISNLQNMAGGYSTGLALLVILAAGYRGGHVITQLLNSRLGRVIAFLTVVLVLWSSLDPYSFNFTWSWAAYLLGWMLDMIFSLFDILAELVGFNG